MAANSHNRRVDGTLIIVLVVILMPLAVVWALSKSASLRGPMARPESRRPVGALVTEAIPEERHEAEDDEGAPDWSIDSDAPEPDRDALERERRASP